MKFRSALMLTAMIALVADFMPAGATAAANGPYCDPGWTEVSKLEAGYIGDRHYVGSVCLGPGDDSPMKARFNFTDYRSTGSFVLTHWEDRFLPGQSIPTRTETGSARVSFSPSNTILTTVTLRKTAGTQTWFSFNLDVSHQYTKTVIDKVTPVVVSVPKTTAQKKAAKKVRDKAIAKAKKKYKAVTKKEKSSKTARSKKAKRAYLKTVKRAKAAYSKAVAPGTGTVNSVTTRQVPDGPPVTTNQNAGFSELP